MTDDVLTASDYEVPGPGQHRVRIEEVEKRDGKFGPYYRLGTKVIGGEFDGLWVSFVASAKLSPAAKLRIAVENILDRKLRKGEKLSPKQDLTGREAIAEVSSRVENERTYANIEQFFPLPPEHANGGSSKDPSQGGNVEGEEEPLPDYNEA